MSASLRELESRVNDLEESVARKFDRLTEIARGISDEIHALRTEVRANAVEDERQNQTLTKLTTRDKVNLTAIVAVVQVVTEIVRITLER